MRDELKVAEKKVASATTEEQRKAAVKELDKVLNRVKK